MSMTSNVSPAGASKLTGFPRKSFCATPDAQWSRRAERSPATCSKKEDPGGDGDGRDRRADPQGHVAPKGASFVPFDEKENTDPVSDAALKPVVPRLVAWPACPQRATLALTGLVYAGKWADPGWIAGGGGTVLACRAKAVRACDAEAGQRAGGGRLRTCDEKARGARPGGA